MHEWTSECQQESQTSVVQPAAFLCADKVEFDYNVMKRIGYFMSLQMSVVITEKCNVMVNSEELIGYHRISDAIDEVSHKPMSV